MIEAYCCPALSGALEKLKDIVQKNRDAGIKTVVFCEDRLSLAAERAVCAAVEGTFTVSVYSFARFLYSARGKAENVLSAQGSAMAIRRIIEEKKGELKLFKKLSSSTAAQSVYDTIALLYSSGISADDLRAAGAQGLLESKISDIALIYGEYINYLRAAGLRDRNEYLQDLPAVIASSAQIRSNCVVFLGFQSFTRSIKDCARACFGAAAKTYGLFIGGEADVYVNEAIADFCKVAEEYGGADVFTVPSNLIAEADKLRVSLFDPVSYHNGDKLPTGKVHIISAADGEEELEFIAATIKKYVSEGERYAKISVMLPDIAGAERSLARIFAEYGIPYYADRRIKLAEHPLCSFVLGYLSCAAAGCIPTDVDGVVASPYFPADRDDKDVFRNYCLRLANFRGGVRRAPSKETLASLKFDICAVERVRLKFLEGLSYIPAKADGAAVCDGVKRILSEFGVNEILNGKYDAFRDVLPAEAELCRRAYEGVSAVLDEARSLAGDMPLRELIKILKSGFSSMEISLIPPKADAVFVGDLAATANTGSNVVFAARLTEDVPSFGADTSLLTDREITLLGKVNLDISPRIMQVNMRKRELTGLNLCAFRKQLFLSWPARIAGEECRPSEIISYARAAFCALNLQPLVPVDVKKVKNSRRHFKYYCCEKTPALKRLASAPSSVAAPAIYKTLEKHGYKREADGALSAPRARKIACAKQLFAQFDSVTPTALETYFTCPYLNFMRQGLRLQEREQGAVRPVDSGNFIHAVLQNIIGDMNGASCAEDIAEIAKKRAEELLKVPPYSSLADSASGQYGAAALVEEAVKVGLGAYEQLKNSRFSVSGAEQKCEVYLGDGIKMFGRVDRVDESGDMVRIIDYKTGAVDSSPAKYYMGLKLQLPLYLLAASEGKRAVGAYYFPASVDYRDKEDGVFRLQGYMDGSDEVVATSDTTLQPACKSAYFDAYLQGRKLDNAMSREDFGYFLGYAKLISRRGAGEMLGGEISPSPAAEACKFCKMGGSCGFDIAASGERKAGNVKCADIAEISKEGGGI